MASDVVMPRLGWTMETGRVVEWMRRDGEQVAEGDVIFSVESDKSVVDVEALDSGVLRIPEGSVAGLEVPVGATIAFITKPGEEPPAWQAVGSMAPAAAPDPEPVAVVPAAPAPTGGGGVGGAISPRALRVARELGIDPATVTGTGAGGRIREADIRAAAAAGGSSTGAYRAAPAVRKLAQEAGVDLGTVASSGIAGRILPADVRQAASRAGIPAGGVTTPMSITRRAIADRMTETARTVVPVTLTTEVDATELVRLRETMRRDLAGTNLPLPSFNDLVARIVALALLEHPALNASMQGDAIVEHGAVHIGVAVDTERGLLAPVIRDAHLKSVHQIAAESAGLIERTRGGNAPMDDLRGSTFTISNLGMFGIDAFTPVINLPEAAILGLGRIVAKPVVVDEASETVEIRRMMVLSLTFDHRVVDGAPAARFLKSVGGMIEAPLVPLTR